ncbi:MAG TPA: hypothetical protein VEC36_05545 [Patescibacteria group bacterium]|nr:hypothetical protein [Patescibacteria group bacterium]
MNLLSIILIGLAGFMSPMTTEERWVVRSESQITIQGSTNIGSYSCSLEKVYSQEPLIYTQTNDNLQFRRNRLVLPVKEFECNNFLIDKDFQELLKAKEYNNIFVEMLELENPESIHGKVSGKVKITIMNSEKVYMIPFQAKHSVSKDFSLTGKVNLVFSDFNLVPPKRFGGMIKIDETIAVNFNLKMQKN